jgi:hypothetical protein
MLSSNHKNIQLTLVSEYSTKIDDWTELSITTGKDSFDVDALDFNTSNVFLIAKKIDYLLPFELNFDFEYKENYALSGGAIFAIVFFILIILAGSAIGVLLLLNRYKIIRIYIPKELRIYCLANIMSEEEIRVVENKKEIAEEIKRVAEKAEFENKMPTEKGFEIVDSFFNEQDDHLKEEFNPNNGFKVPGELVTYV